MKKSEQFDLLIDAVCRECEVSRESLINDSKLQAVVEARTLAVHYLKRIGLTNDTIALIVLRKQAGDMSLMPTLHQIKMKAKSVAQMDEGYYERKRAPYPQSYELMEKEIKAFCHTKYKEVKEPWMKELR